MRINFEPRLQRSWIALGVAAVGVVGKVIVGNQQNKAANAAQNTATGYNQNAIDSQQSNVNTAKQLFNAPMFGLDQLNRNIYGNEANTTAANARGATSGSQFLASQAANEAQTNQGFQNAQLQNAQNKYGLLNNLNLANQGMANQYNFQGQSKQNQANILGQSSLTNYFGAFNDAAGLAATAVKAGQGQPKPQGETVSDTFNS